MALYLAMKISNLFVSVSLSLALLGGCSKSGGGAEKMVAMMEDLGNAVEKAGDDCGKMASAVEGVANKYDLKAMKAEAEKMKGDKKQAEEMMKKYGPRMEKVMPKLMGMMKCADDPKMKAVNEKFQGMM
jgi:DNA-binding ferritin-like protein